MRVMLQNFHFLAFLSLLQTVSRCGNLGEGWAAQCQEYEDQQNIIGLGLLHDCCVSQTTYNIIKLIFSCEK